MLKVELSLFCLCGTPLKFDDYEYYCENCEVRFPRYVFKGNEKIDLISSLDLVSKDNVTVLEDSLIETYGEVEHFLTTYVFVRSGQDWSLTDIKETKKVWEDVDPNIVSDEIQLLLEEIVVDFHFSMN